MDGKSDTGDGRVAVVSARQHGVISVAQLRASGVTDDAIRRRVESGRLHRIHRGVYAVGHRGLSQEGWWMAAALACGEGAVLSHRSAAELWRLLRPDDGPIEVSVPTAAGRKRRRGIRIHRRASLSSSVTTRRSNIPVTTPSQTIADLRGVVPRAQWRRAARQAEVQGLRTGLEKSPDPTRSELEELFLRLCRRYQLPKPTVNVQVGRYEVDFLWASERLIVEPTAIATTAAPKRSRTTTSETWSCERWATRYAATPTGR
jgi:Transcriptional regulator, AbiEi antitoxin